MQKSISRLSPLLKWAILCGLFFVVFMTIMRIVFFYKFSAPGSSIFNYNDSFILGFRYDIRVVSGIILFLFIAGSLKIKKEQQNADKNKLPLSPTVVASSVVAGLVTMYLLKVHPGLIISLSVIFALVFFTLLITENLNPFEDKTARKIMKSWFLLIAVILALFTMADFEHYDYLRQRLSAGVFDYALDVKISLGMIWESYPISEILLYTTACMIIVVFWLKFSFKLVDKHPYHPEENKNLFSSIVFIFLLILGMLGQIYPRPLRWSDSFVFKNNFKTNLSLNPFQSFLSTVPPVDNKYDIKEVQKYYPQISEYLQVTNPDIINLNFNRNYISPASVSKKNVIIVLCESFSMYKSSMSGNKLNTTPFFNQLCDEGIFFDRCFTPAYGTARGVWATITGIPDVEYPNTSTRIPAAQNQHTIINDYQGYKKFYFLGGDAEWASLGTFLRNNIDSLRLIDEKKFPSQKVNVWGISDKDLFLLANDTLKSQTTPFIAIIQTSNNHRPYTIPSEDRGKFKEVSYPGDTLYKYGFDNNKELNAFRYSDFVFQNFMEAAGKEDYFKNTLFVFIGDHGIAGNMDAVYPSAWEEAGLGIHHVPLLFYAPHFLKAAKENRICSQLDVLPTATALAGVSYTNTTLGINLMSANRNMAAGSPNAFLYDPTIQKIGVINDSLIYGYNLLEKQDEIFPMAEDEDPSEIEEKSAAGWSMGWYQTSKYLLNHNQQSRKR